jgi:ribonuclease P protein component
MEVMEKGRIYTSPLFVMRVLDNQTFGISAVAPKKHLPTAVKRNHMRRQVYETVRTLIPSVLPNMAVIIFSKKETNQATFEMMKSDLKQLFLKARISV